MGFPSPAIDYIEPRLTLNSMLRLHPAIMMLFETAAGFVQIETVHSRRSQAKLSLSSSVTTRSQESYSAQASSLQTVKPSAESYGRDYRAEEIDGGDNVCVWAYPANNLAVAHM